LIKETGEAHGCALVAYVKEKAAVLSYNLIKGFVLLFFESPVLGLSKTHKIILYTLTGYLNLKLWEEKHSNIGIQLYIEYKN
jgi:hypothetical protein